MLKIILKKHKNMCTIECMSNNSNDWQTWNDSYNDRSKKIEESLTSILIKNDDDDDEEKKTIFRYLLGGLIILFCSIVGIILYIICI